MIASEKPPPPPSTPEAASPRPHWARVRRSSPVAMILLYLIFVFIGAALISPRLYASAQFLESISYRFAPLADAPFHRYVSRCLIALAILGIPTLFRVLNLRSVSVLGLKWSARHCTEGVHGFLWGFVALAMLAALMLTFEVRTINLEHTGAEWIRHLKNAALSAALVASLEELIFRGALFSGLRQRQTFFHAMIFSSALYALLHFLEKPVHPGRWVEWNSGLIVVGQMLRGFADSQAMVPAFLNLLLVGALLALVFERTGSILFSVGLHAGFVFWLKTLNFVTEGPEALTRGFWGTGKVTDGWAATIVLAVIFCLVERTLAPRKKEVA